MKFTRLRVEDLEGKQLEVYNRLQGSELGEFRRLSVARFLGRMLERYFLKLELTKQNAEFQKMIRGENFVRQIVIEELIQESYKLQVELNGRLGTIPEVQSIIFESLFGKFGKEVFIRPPFNCDFGINIEIDDYASINKGAIILDCSKVKIGKMVRVGPNVNIASVSHPTDPFRRRLDIEVAPTILEDNCWLTTAVVVHKGVTVGRNSVVASNSVVNQDVPPNVLVGGNPCKFIKDIECHAEAEEILRYYEEHKN